MLDIYNQQKKLVKSDDSLRLYHFFEPNQHK
jgi:hypothetical protein